MAIRSLRDVNDAHENGRYHQQRFFKSANAVSNVPPLWTDWAYAAGQPAYDARIGSSGQFNPVVAAGNDAIHFPPIDANKQRYISSVTIRTGAAGTGQTTTDIVLYDLLGLYPLIDGDSTDIQTLANDNPLPRYSDGRGVFPVIVNHVSPMVVNAGGTITYTGSDDVDRSVNFGVLLGAPGHVVSCPTAADSASANARGAFTMSLHSGASGVKAIKDITFSTAPGGLFSIYLVRPLMSIANHDGASATDKIATEKFPLMQDGWRMPRVYDGAHLGFFLRANSSTYASIFGNIEFIWG